MFITTLTLWVDDQAAAAAFYTEVLGFAVKDDVPVGEHRWLTLVSTTAPEGFQGVQLSLEPSDHPAVGPLRTTLVEEGIPFTSFGVADVAAEHARLEAFGVRFTQGPTDLGPVTIATFDDTVGNLIQIAAMNG